LSAARRVVIIEPPAAGGGQVFREFASWFITCRNAWRDSGEIWRLGKLARVMYRFGFMPPVCLVRRAVLAGNMAATEVSGLMPRFGLPWGELPLAFYEVPEAWVGLITPCCGGLEVGRQDADWNRKKRKQGCFCFFLPLWPQLRLRTAPSPLSR